MEDIFVFLTALISLVVITVWIYCAIITAKISTEKGYNGAIWFLIGLGTGVFAVIAVGVLPSKFK
ncbi:MAG: hypothetical protein IJD28_00355 [Deferribacterales bacterium]|nr:hypothetical protein [Deferribacterales bacterium]